MTPPGRASARLGGAVLAGHWDIPGHVRTRAWWDFGTDRDMGIAMSCLSRPKCPGVLHGVGKSRAKAGRKIGGRVGGVLLERGGWVYIQYSRGLAVSSAVVQRTQRMAGLQTTTAEHAQEALQGALLQGALPEAGSAASGATAAPSKPRNHLWKPGQSANPKGRKPGTPNRVNANIREAIEKACAPGACHPQGLAGWLIDRAQGGVQDRQIFAGLVSKALPAQLQASVQHGGVVVQLGWLQGRSVGRNGTPTSQSQVIDSQVIDVTEETDEHLRVGHTASAPAATDPTPHPP